MDATSRQGDGDEVGAAGQKTPLVTVPVAYRIETAARVKNAFPHGRV